MDLKDVLGLIKYTALSISEVRIQIRKPFNLKVPVLKGDKRQELSAGPHNFLSCYMRVMFIIVLPLYCQEAFTRPEIH